MTLPPTDSWQVRGVTGPDYKVGPYCSNPGCNRLAEHAHHMWRRTMLGGVFSWVELPRGEVVGNLTGLCPECHEKITGRIGGHKAAIRVTQAGVAPPVFWWCTLTSPDSTVEYEFQAPLDPQPPTRETLVASPADTGSDRCPTCGQPQPRRRPSAPPLGGRRRSRKKYVIQVPDDAQEHGAEVLDTLIENLAPLLHVEPDKNGRYYVVVPALYFADQERERFVESILGRGD
jgi:hypothetical protein